MELTSPAFEHGKKIPPKGEHRYFWRLYALDDRLDLPEGATRIRWKPQWRGTWLRRRS